MKQARRNHPYWVALGWLLMVPATGMLVLYHVPSLQRHRVTAMAASFIPHVAALWLLAGLVLVLAARGWGKLVVAIPLLGLLAHAQVLQPYLSLPQQPDPADHTIATLNLRFGEADLAALARNADVLDASVLVLTEVTPPAARALQGEPWMSTFPHRAGAPADAAAGTLVLSRYPLAELGSTPDTAFTNVAARVSSPTGEFVVLGVHPANPTGGASTWLSDARAVTALAATYRDGPLVVAGDLNATLEHLTLRELLARGLTDAAAAAGAGWLPTYPANRPYPPLIAIDHILVSREFTATAAHTFEVPGTDHLGLVAALRRE